MAFFVKATKKNDAVGKVFFSVYLLIEFELYTVKPKTTSKPTMF